MVEVEHRDRADQQARRHGSSATPGRRTAATPPSRRITPRNGPRR
ncbi:hypothetical protein [Nonomuraea roseoviolacea]